MIVGPAFVEALTAWRMGLAAMVRAGTDIMLDDVFLGGGDSQHRLRTDLGGLDVLWVGVQCDAQTAEAREAARGGGTHRDGGLAG